MGKGQRARENRAQEKIENPAKNNVKKKPSKGTPKWVAPLVTVVIVAAVIGLVALSYLSSNGVLLRNKTVMSSDNFEVSGTVMQYATMQTYQNYVNQFQQMGLIDYLGIDTTKSLSAQEQSEGKTWLEFFRESTEDLLSEMLIYCEAAKAEGVELDEKEQEQIDAVIESLADAASASGYTEKAFLAANFGKGVNADDVRDFYELQLLSSKYESKVSKETEEAVKDEEIEAYYKEHAEDYTVADVIYAEETITFDEGMTAEEKSEKKAELDAEFAAFAAAQTEADFKAALLDYYKANASEDDDETPEEKLEAAVKTVDKADISYEEAAEWVFERADDAYLRADGESKVFADNDGETADAPVDEPDVLNPETADTEAVETDVADTEAVETETADTEAVTEAEAEVETADDDAEETEYTAAAYFIARAPYPSEEETKNVGHILFSLDTYGSEEAAKAEADRIYAEYKAGEMTKESFEALGEANTDDGNVFYNNVKSGEMVTEFDAWIFDSARQSGDTELVLTEYGYHLMYFVGEGDPSWIADCKEAITGEKTGDLYEEYEAKYAVSVDADAMKSIKG